MNGSSVPPAVGTDAFVRNSRNLPCRSSHVLLETKPCPRSTEGCAVTIYKNGFVRRSRLALQKCLQKSNSLRPEATDAFFTTLSQESYLGGCFQADCAPAQ